MNSHKVSFGRIAKTLLFEDEQGILVFCWELDTSASKKHMVLERQPLSAELRELGREVLASDRVAIALAAAHEYLKACGYTVELRS